MALQAVSAPANASRRFHWAFVTAWVFCLLFYFTQYAIRSAPGVMIPELTAAFGLSAVGVSSLLGVYYYTYSTFAIVAGASLDRWGAKYTIPIGVTALAVGIVMFGLGIEWVANVGRLLQGAGAAFAFVGCRVPGGSWIPGPLSSNGRRIHAVHRDARGIGRTIRCSTADPRADYLATFLALRGPRHGCHRTCDGAGDAAAISVRAFEK
jgi:hypothetical protein